MAVHTGDLMVMVGMATAVLMVVVTEEATGTAAEVTAGAGITDNARANKIPARHTGERTLRL
jgi:alcohol dehydrogenase class IV